MLAFAQYRLKKDFSEVTTVLENAVKSAPKNGILWSMYGWLLAKEDRLDDAVSVLARGVEAASDDPHLKENYQLVQNRKKPKMKAYGEQWYQFGLEQPRVATRTENRSSPNEGHGSKAITLIMPNQQIGRYRLIRRLASGGMGEIYLAEASGAANFSKQVAIKCIYPTSRKIQTLFKNSSMKRTSWCSCTMATSCRSLNCSRRTDSYIW